MATRSKLPLAAAAAGLTVLLIVPGVSKTAPVSSLSEDFTTLAHADLSASSGLWNIVDHEARGAAFADADASRPITFGDGHDGILESSTGYEFDTDAHPDGYDFQSVAITGGTIKISGSHPLVIRSLSALAIATPMRLSGTDGDAGAVNGSTAGPAGGSASGSAATGGAGGTANASSAGDGGDGRTFAGTTDSGTGGGAGSAVLSGGDANASSSASGPGLPATFDSAFLGGPGGGGGGGGIDGGGNYGTGGGGGAGGGAIRLIAVGDLVVPTLRAKGGSGGIGATDGAGVCAGNGGGGDGGAIWLQSLHAISSAVQDVSEGTGATNGCGFGSSDGIAGAARGDAVSGAFSGYATSAVPAGAVSFVQSAAFDLRVLSADFPEEPVVTASANGGQVSTSYAGSVDGTSFSAFSTTLGALSGLNYRYLKFRVTFTGAATAGPSPTVSRIALTYSDRGATGLAFTLGTGCGSLAMVPGSSRLDPDRAAEAAPASIALFAFFGLLLAGLARPRPNGASRNPSPAI